jgi:hypothetical protein
VHHKGEVAAVPRGTDRVGHVADEQTETGRQRLRVRTVGVETDRLQADHAFNPAGRAQFPGRGPRTDQLEFLHVEQYERDIRPERQPAETREVERYFAAVIAADTVTPALASQPGDIRAWQWWTIDDIRRTSQRIYPTGLADLVSRFLEDGPPPAPIELD